MIAENMLAWARKERKVARNEGILLGEAALLKRLILQRFSEVPEWAEKRLARASREDLESWGVRLLDARSIEDVFTS